MNGSNWTPTLKTTENKMKLTNAQRQKRHREKVKSHIEFLYTQIRQIQEQRDQAWRDLKEQIIITKYLQNELNNKHGIKPF